MKIMIICLTILIVCFLEVSSGASVTVKPENMCSDQPCKNGGSCIVREIIQKANQTIRERICSCPKGFNGTRCENKISNRFLNFWQNKNNPQHSFSRDPVDKSVWYETLNGKNDFTFKLINENQNEVLLFDGNRGYSVKLNDQSCLLQKNSASGFFEIYSGFWKN